MDIAKLATARPMRSREPRYNTERHRFFKERGWICVEDVLTRDEVREARDELQRITEGKLGTTYKPGKSSVKYQGESDYARVADKSMDVSRYSDVFNRVVRSPKIAAVVKEVTGLSSIRLFGDQVINKAPEATGGLGSSFHQDMVYYPIDRGGGATIWVALGDLPAHAGTLRFVDASHRRGPLGRGSGLGGWLAAHPEDEELTTAALDLSAGSATIHDHLTIHGTDPNRWDQPRIGYMITYMPADARYTGMPSRWTDGLGLEVDGLFDHKFFPIVG